MNTRLEIPQSLEGLWLLWLLSAGLCTLLTLRALTPIRWRHLQCVLTREDGAAYTLSYVMVIPIYALLMCLMIETPLILSAKLGTVYAGYSAARSASVWSSAGEWKQAEEKAKLAGLKAFVPFSSGTQPVFSGGVPQQEMLLHYNGAYLAFAGVNGKVQSPKYLLKKISYATKHLQVEVEQPASWDTDITVKVHYEFPFNVPGIGRLLGKRTIDGRYVYPISTQVTMHNEAPQNDAQTLGIGYGTFND